MLYNALNIPHVHEILVKIGSYIIAEYGVTLKKDPYKLFDVLHRHFEELSHSGKAMLLNAYIKMAHTFPDLQMEVQSVLEIHADHVDTELQQRAIEYLALLEEDDKVEVARKLALKKMPCFSDKI